MKGPRAGVNTGCLRRPPRTTTRGITLRGKRLAAVTAGATLLVGMGSVGGAAAGMLVTSSQIKDNTILSRDVHDGTLKQNDLRPPAVAAFNELNGYEIIRGSYPVLDASLDWV